MSRADLGIPEDAFVVGAVGRISRQKAPDIFVRAARRIREAIPAAHFILVGSGTMDEAIREYVDENNLADCVHITGWVEDPLDYANLFDVACLISRWEGFGLVLPEYMMLGKPIVATNVDAIPEIITDGETGLLVPPEDDAAVADAVIRLHQDEALRDRLITNAGHSLSRFDIQRVAREHGELFTELIDKR